MDDDVLLTIGAFARAVELSPSALRYYDECGLLAPAEVDGGTGYRYYTPELESRARLIRWMRDVGVPVETMRVVLDGGTADARTALGAFLTERTEHAARAANVVTDVLRELDRVEEGDRPASVVVDGPELAAAVRQVRHAADNDPASPLSCVLLELDGRRLDVVATNRYWMAWRELTVPDLAGRRTPSPTRAVLSPGGAIRLVERLERGGELALVLADGHVSIEEPGSPEATTELETRAVAYPAHRLIIGALDEPATRVTVDRDALRQTLADATRVVVEVEVGEQEIRLTGVATTRLPAGVRGRSVGLFLSVPLWARAVEACLGPEVIVEIRSGRHPVTVRSAYQPSFVALVMPTTGTDA